MEQVNVNIGLLGCGTVGTSLLELIHEQREVISQRTGLVIDVAMVSVRDVSKSRTAPIDPTLFTDDPKQVVESADVDVVVEVMGGIDPSRELISKALELGKPVVTANKELLAAHGEELYALADQSGVDLLFEAAVAGGIPIIRPLRESLAGEPITRVMGIVNGTTNFILTKMTEEGMSFADALEEAQKLGYAESDPTADVGGHDAAAKAAIIASLAFGGRVNSDDVYVEGITEITPEDIEFAHRLGHCIKLLAIVEKQESNGAESLCVRVHPSMVPLTHPLANVQESFNAIFVEGDSVGELMFYGRGAGGPPTASAVLGDLIDASCNIKRSSAASIGDFTSINISPIADLETQYFFEVEVEDQPGVLAQVAAVLGEQNVSIQSMEQEGLESEARLIFITHKALESSFQAAIGALDKLKIVRNIGTVLRVIGID
ncbi:MAG: homoserine dehydrogenase [Actinomycetota bacterium]|nr:homoserine dehydrogenase [Actinomycetota bacterium]MED5276957.1 homoserine dehydrogenase [Actinomycetota bacterium]|tara:strand:+ start:10602 stop:11900 length:1299 start_codon:yes stop_codon:yes gene_type:complete